MGGKKENASHQHFCHFQGFLEITFQKHAICCLAYSVDRQQTAQNVQSGIIYTVVYLMPILKSKTDFTEFSHIHLIGARDLTCMLCFFSVAAEIVEIAKKVFH